MDFLLEASHIQKEYGELFHLIKFSLDAIWIPEMVVPGSGQDVETTAMATGNLEQVQNVQHYAMISESNRLHDYLLNLLLMNDSNCRTPPAIQAGFAERALEVRSARVI